VEKVIAPVFRVTYAGKDITADVSKDLIELSYADRSEGESDELSITVQDRDAKWRTDWYPEKGAKLTLEYGYAEDMVSAGDFEIDEISAAGPPDVLAIRALAAVVNKQIRTKRSVAHENKTLKQIVEATAQRAGLTLEGKIENVRIARITQNRKTDIEFLRDLADAYGYIFNIRGDRLVFTSIFDLEDGEPVAQIRRRELTRYNIKDKINFTYRSAQVAYANPLTKKVVRGASSGLTEINADLSVNEIESRGRAEDPAQAALFAKVALYRANSRQQEGSVELPGRPSIVSGVCVELVALGKLSGKFYVERSTHTFTRDNGYTTSLELKRVGLVDSSMQAPEPVEETKKGYEIEDL
jgi:uncharacterized protein